MNVELPTGPKGLDRLAQRIGDAIEEATGHDYLDCWTAYGVAGFVLEYLTTGDIKPKDPYS